MASSFGTLMAFSMTLSSLWMLAAMSPVHWVHARLLTAEMPYLSPSVRQTMDGFLAAGGFDLAALPACPDMLGAGTPPPYLPSGRMPARSLGYCLNNGIGWSCSTTELLMLGLMFPSLLIRPKEGGGWCRGWVAEKLWRARSRVYGQLR